MIDQEALFLLKEAFKRSLREHLGPIEEKPIPELRGWSLALIELASECRERQIELEDFLRDKAEDKHGDHPPNL